ncbi:Glyoxalase/bleomycin resistance protein/dioxygenase [Paenibacillus curdlanolyticus YK9]|uniref:Glyoxalase/bleomycin resistance protein/dioxygenase n=1 Tax=Paenibacillus curdlanolyticus YK9 TaxID=717606 RepID=E0IAY1_9BACL|nr:VOC family protein [Paenibacillus curdlanolyticus]EFM10272.1 Glyoxalase/bleomycin resistance protein/dioxygenase [Paenibacillus curdlanolyticus YK9]
MEIKETGIILFCEDYELVLKFYEEKLGLPVRQRGDELAILEFGGSYLMIENGGIASANEKTRSQNAVVIRFNVHDVDSTAAQLVSRGVPVDVRRFHWGTVGVIIDPEGNRIELKD